MTRTRKAARFSLHIHPIVRDLLREVIPDDAAYDRAFDRFELLVGLMVWDLRESQGRGVYAPLGRFAWLQDPEDHSSPVSLMEREVEEQRQNWLLVRRGLFGRDFTKARAALAGIKKQIVETPRW